MNATLEHIVRKYGVRATGEMPVEIPNMGRNELAGLFAELGFKTGAEIGVEAGKYSAVLCKSIPGLHLYAVDPFLAYDRYREHVTPEQFETFRYGAHERLKGYNVTFVEAFSVDAAKKIKDESLDFVYIDGNHTLPFVIADLAAWSRTVKKGGIVAGHDYAMYPSNQVHVIQATNAWTSAYRIKPWFLLGLRSKEDRSQIRDHSRSWMWVQENGHI